MLRRISNFRSKLQRISQQLHRRRFQLAFRQRYLRPGMEGLEGRLMLAADDVISVGRVLSSWSAADIQNDSLTLTYTVYNQQSSPVTDTRLTTTLQPGVTFNRSSQIPIQSGQDLAWSLGTIPAFGHASIEVTVTLLTTIPHQIDGGVHAFGIVDSTPVTDVAPSATLRTDFVAADLVSATPDANSSDPFVQALTAQYDYDPEEMFQFVRDHVAYESYSGSLRGARGAIWSGAGNALDQASLLIAMLRGSGIEAQYVQGTLTDANARSLIREMFPATLRVLGCLADPNSVAAPEFDSLLLSESQNHTWVQFDVGGGMQNADPSFRDAIIGQSFTTEDATFVEVPEELRHTATIRLERELTTPGLGFLGGGSAQETAVVLEQSFNTVELVGRPISIGHFVQTSTFGFVISSTTTRYTPYLIVGEIGDAGTRDELVTGDTYQDVLTNFPFGSQIVTGVFLDVEIQSPDGSVETLERTLADRIGFAARRLGGSGSIIGDPAANSLFDPLDITTVSIMPSKHFEPALAQIATDLQSQSDEYEAFFAEFAATPEGPQRDALLSQAIEQSRKSIIAGARSRIVSFEHQSDLSTEILEALALVKSYWDRPRVTIVNSEVSAPVNGPTTIGFGIDLRSNNPRVLAFPGQAMAAEVGFRIARGFAENGVEAAVMAVDSDVATNDIVIPNSTTRIFSAADAQGIAIVVLNSGDRSLLNSLDISDEARIRISDALASGMLVIVPAQAVMIDGVETIGWFQQNVHTGETIAVLENGTHGAIVEYFGLEIDVAAQSAADQFAFGFLAGAGLNTFAGIAKFIYGAGIIQANSELAATTLLGIKQAIATFTQLVREAAIRSLAGTPPAFQAGFLVGFAFGTVTSTDPPVGSSLFGLPPSDAFDSLSGVELAIGIVLDPVFSVPFFGAQLPTVFRAGIKNTGVQDDTYVFNVRDLPLGFTAQTSVPQIHIPAGETAEISICLQPTSGLPPAGTDASFSFEVVSSTNPGTQSTVLNVFTVPEIHAVSLSFEPTDVTTAPGVATSAQLVVQGHGNVSDTVTFDVLASAGLNVTGLQSVTVNPNETAALTIFFTPDASTLLNSTLNAEIEATFGGLLPETTLVRVRVSAPGVEAIGKAATAALQLGNLTLADRLNDLSFALTNLVQTPENTVFKSQALATLESVVSLFANDNVLSAFAKPLNAAAEQLRSATTVADIQAAIAVLGERLEVVANTVVSLSNSNFELFLNPSAQVAQPQVPTRYELLVHNIGLSETTYNVDVVGIPAGVDVDVDIQQVTLARDEFATISVTLTSTSLDELHAFEFLINVSVDGASEVIKTVHGSLTARKEFVSVVSVNATPQFTDAGGAVKVSARVLNAVNREQRALASFVIRDSNGQQVASASTPVDVTLTVQTSLVSIPLGSFDTSGLANGNYSIALTLMNFDGDPIPGATGLGSFLVGSPLTASVDVLPSVLPPGTNTVINTLQIEALEPPSNEPITLVGHVTTSGGSRGVAARNNIAYASGPNGIQIIDYSNLEIPVIVGTLPGNHYGAVVQDNVLLALRPSGPSFILDVYALQDTPLSPPLIGSSPAINYNLAVELKANSTHAFVGQLNVCFFLGSQDVYHQAGDLISIALNLDSQSNPTTATPTLDNVLSNTNGDNLFDPTDVSGCAENGGDHNVFGIAVPEPQTVYLATTTVTGGNTQAGVGRIQVVDVSNPTSPSVIRELDIPGTVLAIGVGISGNVGVVIGSTGGFQDNPNGILTGNLTVTTLDVSDLYNPRIITSRVLDRITATFWVNFVNLGNGLFGFSNLGFEDNQGHPAVIVIDASNPRSPLIGQSNIPIDLVAPNSLSTDGTHLFTADSNGVSIYLLNPLQGLPVTVQVQIPNNNGVEIIPGSFNIPPTAMISGVGIDIYTFDLTLTPALNTETLTWQTVVEGLQPGESRAVTLGTTVDFSFQGTTGIIELPRTSVIAEQVMSLLPGVREVRPGEEAPFSVVLTNPSSIPVTYDLSVIGVPHEWIAIDSQMTVPPGGTAVAYLTLTSDPFDVVGDYAFVVNATVDGVIASVIGNLLLTGAPVLPEVRLDSQGVEISLTPSSAVAGVGTVANYVTRVTNVGSSPDDYVLFVTGLPAGFEATFDAGIFTVPPGANDFRDVHLTITVPIGAIERNFPFTVVAASITDVSITGQSDGILTVLPLGVSVDITPESNGPSSTFQMQVTNTGKSVDTFDLSLAAPAALMATLEETSVVLQPGQSTLVTINVDAIAFALPGSLMLVGIARSRANALIYSSDSVELNIQAFSGLRATFEQATQQLAVPGSTTYILLVDNIGNLEDEFSATILSTNGPISANLEDLNGGSVQTIPIFRLPGLASGALRLNASLLSAGSATVTVRVASRSHPAITADAIATLLTESATTLSIAAASADKAEGNSGNTAFTFTVSRSGNVSGATTVDYAVSGNGLVPADAFDFGSTFPIGQIDFAANETTKTIVINVHGDVSIETDERFMISLSNASADASIISSTAFGTIRNDDAEIGFSLNCSALRVGLNTCTILGGTPGGVVNLALGVQPGNRFLPKFGITLEMHDPTVVAQGIVQPDGRAVVQFVIANAQVLQQVLLQAFEHAPKIRFTNIVIVGAPLLAASPQGTGTSTVEASVLPMLLSESIRRWELSDISAQERDLLQTVRVEFADLPTGMLGRIVDQRVFLDSTADGHGWFVDSTPADDSEFDASSKSFERMAALNSPAYGHMDLLSVIMHELGHVLGHGHAEIDGEPSYQLMTAELPINTRRLLDTSIYTAVFSFDLSDINRDGYTSPIDALLIINQLNLRSTSGAVTVQDASQFDVNRDGRVSPIDALLVINSLNRQRLVASGEGEGWSPISIYESHAHPVSPTSTYPFDDKLLDVLAADSVNAWNERRRIILTSR